MGVCNLSFLLALAFIFFPLRYPVFGLYSYLFWLDVAKRAASNFISQKKGHDHSYGNPRTHICFLLVASLFYIRLQLFLRCTDDIASRD